jgi:1-acyl-sn-glycerol-3-phosphate acyltransferase
MREPETTEQLEKEPGVRERELLRWLYTPYSLGVVWPWLTGSTIGLGAAAVALTKVSPRLAFHVGTAWAWLMCRVNWNKVRVHGRENADPNQSYVIMMNHQSQFDILAFYGHYGRQFRWVMKEELRKVPGIGWYTSAGGHVFIDRSDREKALASLNAAKSVLDGGISVVFFPEGTRSRNGRMRPFKKGGFMMALQMGLPILPVSISGSRYVLPADSFRPIPGRIDITLQPPIDTSQYTEETVLDLMADTRASIASGLTPWERND